VATLEELEEEELVVLEEEELAPVEELTALGA